jgi:dipeptidyl aminopeptidase/acylaminoacyl peptidase
MGHSYGGYETAFIINHSQLFKTAIPSGAIIDLTSMFLNINANTGKPDMWRFAKQQWQMLGKTPFEHPKDFERNSPLASVTGLKIPVMHWTGKVDAQVDWHQSIEYYLALRRLGKKNIMLLYPGEGHNLLKPANQEDLMRRVLQWFGYFLKNEKNVEWISKGIQ